jgi:hypothetical protein
LGVPRQRPGRVPHQGVDIAGLQRGEAISRRQCDEFYLGGVIEERRRNGAAVVNVQSGPIALGIRQTEARELAADAAVEHAALLDRV